MLMVPLEVDYNDGDAGDADDDAGDGRDTDSGVYEIRCHTLKETERSYTYIYIYLYIYIYMYVCKCL